MYVNEVMEPLSHGNRVEFWSGAFLWGTGFLKKK